ncbi:MAG: MFS transporter [Chloroflexi bacterium]|nr:MAG: MFS transporter [Chloroflexota bacterium]
MEVFTLNTRARNTAIGSILITTLYMGSYGSLAVYLVPVSQAFHVSVGEATLIFTFGSMASFTSALFLGRMLKKFAVKLLIPLTGILFTALFLSIAFSRSIVVVYVGALLYGFASGTGGIAFAQTAITWWFVKDRGKLFSYLSIGTALFGLLLVPLIAQMITIYGVRVVAIYQGFLISGMVILIGLFLLSEHPDTYGLKPIGYMDEQKGYNDVQSGTNLTVNQILRIPAFWLIIFSVVIMIIVFTGFINNASAIYQSKGLDAVAAAFCISIYNAGRIVWSPFYGILVDKFGVRLATIVCGSIGAIILLLATLLSGFTGAVIIASMIGSLSFAGMLGAVSLPRVFGSKEAGNLIGFSNAAGSVGAMIGAPTAGFIFDATNSYTGFLFFAGIAVPFAVFLMLSGTGKKAVETVKLREAQYSH